jgi:hypothetical protein
MPLTHQALHAALQAAAGNRRPAFFGQRRLLKLGHLGLRLRYTLAGRWLYRIIPVRWQQVLKRMLLGYDS